MLTVEVRELNGRILIYPSGKRLNAPEPTGTWVITIIKLLIGDSKLQMMGFSIRSNLSNWLLVYALGYTEFVNQHLSGLQNPERSSHVRGGYLFQSLQH